MKSPDRTPVTRSESRIGIPCATLKLSNAERIGICLAMRVYSGLFQGSFFTADLAAADADDAKISSIAASVKVRLIVGRIVISSFRNSQGRITISGNDEDSTGSAAVRANHQSQESANVSKKTFSSWAVADSGISCARIAAPMRSSQ